MHDDPGRVQLGEALMAAQSQIEAVSDSPRLDAELLMSHVTGLGRAQLLVRLQDRLTADEAQRFSALAARRARGEPVAYLLSEQGFWTLTLRVTPDVLVPRADTEVLVEWALELLRDVASPRIADLGTGSGALGLALASERRDAEVLATDASQAALAVAADNAQTLNLSRVRFIRGHWCEALPTDAYDLIVSNPPYIAHDDRHLADLRFEPLSALTDGADGLNALREIIATAGAHLRAGGWLLVEHGYDQAAAVRVLFEQAGFADVGTRRDYGEQERATAGRWPVSVGPCAEGANDE